MRVLCILQKNVHSFVVPVGFYIACVYVCVWIHVNFHTAFHRTLITKDTTLNSVVLGEDIMFVS